MRHVLLLAGILGSAAALAQPGPPPGGRPPPQAQQGGVELVIGKPAPDFTAKDIDGNSVTLSSLKGNVVVLEWFNADCPFVKYAHGPGGPLASLPHKWIDKGVKWFAVNSSAPGKQGHGLERNRAARGEYGMKYAVLLDEAGTVGKAYGARSTPHVFVVGKSGTLMFAGGLDNAPQGQVESGSYTGYVDLALTELLAGKAITTPRPRNYGCSVKYAS
jgi:peroxiredoxin